MADSSDIIKYYRACFASEYNELSITNFLGTAIKHRLYLRGSKAINGEIDKYPVRQKWAELTKAFLTIHGGEYQLGTGVLFVTGKRKVGNRVLKACVPLLVYPTIIGQDEDGYYFQCDLQSPKVQPAAIQILSNDTGRTERIRGELLNILGESSVLDFTTVSTIQRCLKENLGSGLSEEILLYPSLLSQVHVNDAIDSEEVKIVSAAAVGLIPQSNSGSSVLFELSELEKASTYSSSLNSLFGKNQKIKRLHSNMERPLSPLTLSEQQKKAIIASHSNDLSTVIGPPGTGKSLTIASMAVDHALRGNSVLIVAGTDEALNVVQDKIDRYLGLDDLQIRAGATRTYKTQARRKARRLRNGIGLKNLSTSRFRQLEREYLKRESKLKELESEFEGGANMHKEHGLLLNTTDRSFLEKMRLWWMDFRLPEKPLHKLSHEWLTSLEEKNRHLRSFILELSRKNRAKAYSKHQQDINLFYQALNEKSGNLKLDLFDQLDFKGILKAFPIWLVKSDDLRDILPLQAELFDVAIFDEASQCTMATAIPALQRAKSAVVVGDPMQLRHVSFLPEKTHQLLANQSGFSPKEKAKFHYRNNSLLDTTIHALTRPEAATFLDEHFRSHPSIISYSNIQFYENDLRIMTSGPSTLNESKVISYHVCGERRSKVNHTEAEEILNQVRAMIDEESESTSPSSIGILSPFRDQVDLLSKMVMKQISDFNLGRHRIRIGTPYSFQGEERDVMWISTTVTAKCNHASYHYLNKDDVFNVAVTRARNEQRIVHSVLPHELPKDNHLRNYMEHNVDATIHGSSNGQLLDTFTLEVSEFLTSIPTVKVYPGYFLAGLTIDILVEDENGNRTCIDLIGYPGEFEDVFPLERYKILSRLECKVIPLAYGEWVKSKVRTKNLLRKSFTEK